MYIMIGKKERQILEKLKPSKGERARILLIPSSLSHSLPPFLPSFLPFLLFSHPKHARHLLEGHQRPVLQAWDVMGPKHVPQDQVLVHERPGMKGGGKGGGWQVYVVIDVTTNDRKSRGRARRCMVLPPLSLSPAFLPSFPS